MRKGEGRFQQIRGQKRAKKVFNRKLNRNRSDIDTVDYVHHVQNLNEVREEIKKTSENE